MHDQVPASHAERLICSQVK